MSDLTQAQVESFIMLAGQTGERWFKLSFIDEGMSNDPTATALMESIADVIHEGISKMDFAERQEQAIDDAKTTGVSNDTH